jgi:hypothetical protein
MTDQRLAQTLGAFAQTILAMVSSLISDREPLHALEGTVVPGSWNAMDGTCAVRIGDSNSNDGEDGDYLQDIRVHLATTHIGDQYGPVGGERISVHHAQSGYVGTFDHGEDDSPGAKSGERFITHRSATGSGQPDGYVKFLNNGQPGDSAGGLSLLAGVLFDVATAGALQIIMSDHLGYIEIGAPGLNATQQAVIRKSDLDAWGASLMTHITTQLDTWATTHLQGGTGAVGPTLTSVPSTGSATVKAAD